MFHGGWSSGYYDTAPDGGWGWVVTFSCFVVHVLVMGSQYAFSVFFNALVADSELGGDSATISLVGSISAAMMLAGSYPAGALVNKFGVRVVMQAGSLLLGGGLVLSSFVPQMWMLYVTNGLVVGIGYALTWAPAMIGISRYFSSNRAFATGLAVSGSGIGMMMMGLLSNFLIQSHGWRTSTRWIALVSSLGNFLAACVMYPVEPPLSNGEKAEPWKPAVDCSVHRGTEKDFLHAEAGFAVDREQEEAYHDLPLIESAVPLEPAIEYSIHGEFSRVQSGFTAQQGEAYHDLAAVALGVPYLPLEPAVESSVHGEVSEAEIGFAVIQGEACLDLESGVSYTPLEPAVESSVHGEVSEAEIGFAVIQGEVCLDLASPAPLLINSTASPLSVDVIDNSSDSPRKDSVVSDAGSEPHSVVLAVVMGPAVERELTAGEILREPGFAAFSFSLLVLSSCIYVPATYITVFATGAGALNADEAAAVVTLTGLSSTVGRIAFGRLTKVRPGTLHPLTLRHSRAVLSAVR
jgi:predicted MFS family arabinose efflux permease